MIVAEKGVPPAKLRPKISSSETAAPARSSDAFLSPQFSGVATDE
jgi:hypothetical protein